MFTQKLFQLAPARRDAETASMRESNALLVLGGERLRHYVIHPESYVKDARSGLKNAHPLTLLDGKLDPFLEAYLRWELSQSTGRNDA
jgi:peptide chain release factor 2